MSFKSFSYAFPTSDLIGIFWKFGLVLDNLPVDVIAWLKEVCILWVEKLIKPGSLFKYVLTSLFKWRYLSNKSAIGWWSTNFFKTS